MTTAQVSSSFPPNVAGDRRVGRIGATRAGTWTFTPGFSAPNAGRGTVLPTLRNGRRCVDLHYSSADLEDLLVTLGRIQAEFHAAEPSAGRRATPLTGRARDV